MSNHIRILKWAAGSPILLPDRLDFNTVDLINLVEAHNLSGRFLQRIREGNAKWITPDLADGLNQLFLETTNQVARNILAFSELSQQLLIKNTHILLIKGISTYILSELKEIMHAGDIDLLSDNPQEVVQTLLNMGYTQTRAPFMHEIGEYSKNSTEFDIHSYFPVYRYSKAMLESDLVPLNHTGEWLQSYQFERSEISYGDLCQYENFGRQLETKLVTVPDANMLAVIISAHAFMNYTNIWSISHREKAYVRLGEIIDLFTLSTHSSFSVERFLNYVNRYQAYDAVEWAASVAVSVFGKNPLPIPVQIGLGDPLPATRFPRCLWWNFWTSLISETDDLLQTRWLSMDWLTDQIGANHLSVCEGQTAKFATINVEDALPLKRFITQFLTPIPLKLYVEKSENGIVIHLQVFSTSRVDIERVRIDLGNIASEWIYAVTPDQQTLVGFPAKSTFVYCHSGYKLTLEFSGEKLLPSSPNSRTYSILIGIARQTNSAGLIASILIPAVITF